MSLVDKVAVLMHGTVRQVASPQHLYRQPADREVASFVGSANFLPGLAQGRNAECELGTVECQGEWHGPVDLLVRPESILLSPAAADSPNRVRGIDFFGHDQLISVQLASGKQIEVRLGPLYNFVIGQPVNVRVGEPVVAYPRQNG